MVAGCGAKLSKMVLFVFNFILWLVGIVLIAVGGYVLARPDTFSKFFGDGTNTLTVACGMIIAVGCLVFLLAFAGCFGACKESACLLKVYIAVLIVLALLEVIGGILSLVYRGSIETTVTDYWNSELQAKKADYVENEADFVDTIQLILKCCGGDPDYKSYKDSWFQGNNSGFFVPGSCCMTYKAGCNSANTGGTDIKDADLIYTEGCTTKVVNFFKDNFLMIGATAIGLIVVEIIAMIFACCVISGINKGEYE